MVPENILCWQKERREGRKKERTERKKRRKRKERKKEGQKKNRKKETAPINSHFVQGQTLGVVGAPK